MCLPILRSNASKKFAASADARFWETNPPGKRIQKNRYAQMIKNNCENRPACGGKSAADLWGAFTNEQNGEKRGASERQKIKS